jgi:hypothetical protein
MVNPVGQPRDCVGLAACRPYRLSQTAARRLREDCYGVSALDRAAWRLDTTGEGASGRCKRTDGGGLVPWSRGVSIAVGVGSRLGWPCCGQRRRVTP